MFGTFLLLLLIFFVVIPLCKIGWRVWNLHRQWQRATQGMRDAYAAAQNAAKKAAKPKKKKKIDPSVGEYVAFEEVKTTATYTSTSTGTTFRAESQIEDAVWEEI